MLWPEVTIDWGLHCECDYNEDAQYLLSCLDPTHLHSNLLDQYDKSLVEKNHLPAEPIAKAFGEESCERIWFQGQSGGQG